MEKTKQRLLVLACLLGLATATAMPAGAQEWAQWRGAGRNGTIDNFTAPASLPKTLTRQWQTAIGSSYASPVVAGARIYVHTRRDEEEVVSCVDWQSGKLLWTASYAAPFAKNNYARQMGKGPFSTPLLHAGRLYTLGVTAILSCFDAKTGALRWRKDYSQFVDTTKLFCGTAMSPVAADGAVIVHVGDDRRGWVMALDAASGNEKWKWEGDGPGYASPVVVDLEGTRQLVTLTDKAAIGIEAATGKLLWRFSHTDEWNENIITPIVYQKSLILSGVRQGTRAISVKRETKEGKANWSATQIWHNPKAPMYMSSPVLDGDYLYGLSSQRKGYFFCLDARTGETKWATQGREATNAVVLAARQHLFLLTDDAELIVAAKSAQAFTPLARYTVADKPTWSHPVIFGKQVLIKDDAHLTMWSFD